MVPLPTHLRAVFVHFLMERERGHSGGGWWRGAGGDGEWSCRRVGAGEWPLAASCALPGACARKEAAAGPSAYSYHHDACGGGVEVGGLGWVALGGGGVWVGWVVVGSGGPDQSPTARLAGNVHLFFLAASFPTPFFFMPHAASWFMHVLAAQVQWGATPCHGLPLCWRPAISFFLGGAGGGGGMGQPFSYPPSLVLQPFFHPFLSILARCLY